MIPSKFNFLFQHVYYIYSEKEERIFNPYRVKNLHFQKGFTRNSKFHSNKNRNGFHERHSIFDIPRIEFANPPAQGTIPDLPPLSRAPYLIIVQTILSCFLCGLKRNLVKPRLSYEVIRSRTIPPNFPLPSISLPLPFFPKFLRVSLLSTRNLLRFVNLFDAVHRASKSFHLSTLVPEKIVPEDDGSGVGQFAYGSTRCDNLVS